jgi:hypothetical protein
LERVCWSGCKSMVTDSDEVDVCLAELPDSTPVSTIVDSDCGKNQIQVLTEAEYQSVALLTLRHKHFLVKHSKQDRR